jgi:hypothetical protein
LALTAFFAGAFVLESVAVTTGLGVVASAAGAAGVAIAGAGMAGNLLVLTCAPAVVASIIPKINQQFVFINLKSV